MQKIAIVGGGQSGLQLAFALLASDYEVTLYSERSAGQVFNMRPPPVPVQFYPSVQYEKELGIDFWYDNPVSRIEGVRFQVYNPAGEPQLMIEAPLRVEGQTLDLRLKYSVWMEEFTKRGGNLVVTSADVPLLEQLAAGNDLVVVAAGRGALTDLFPVDHQKTVFSRPQRKLALFYVHGCALNYRQGTGNGGSYNIMPGVGELMIAPFLSKSLRQAYYILVEAVPGSPLDFLDTGGVASRELENLKGFFREHYPSLYQIIGPARLVEEGEWFSGAITPCVREVAGRLPSGRLVMGLGDQVILNDPLLAQGLNGASKMARFVGDAIKARGNAPFTQEWMLETFDAYWETAQYNTLMTNSMLGQPEPHQMALLAAASQNPAIAADFVNGIGQTHTLYPWFGEAEAAAAYLASHQ